jgi:predicted  nucleic acid-binding Zn-ribbon protein
MKNILLLAGITMLMISCGPDYKTEVERMMRERDSLMAQYDAKDSVINGYMQDIAEIQTSIEGLTAQEEMLNREGANNTEISQDAKTRIMGDIEGIRQMIDQNKKKLSDLQSRVRKSNVKVAELEKMIGSLNSQLAVRDSSINSLNENIFALNGKITTMQTEIDTIVIESARKTAEITDKTTKLHTAYYTVGDYKTLRDKKVLAKQGGFLGLGKAKTMVPDFNREAFTQIDFTSTKTIQLNTTSAKLLSTHPTGSYNLLSENKKVTAIEITDPEKFWQASKYLVVVTD